MAEDGMLVNFSIGDGPFAVQSTFKGGSWKDRLTAKKAALYNRNRKAKLDSRAQTAHDPQGRDIQFAQKLADRLPKRRRVEKAGNHTYKLNQAHLVQPSTESKQDKAKPQQVVSSLFTFNPRSKSADLEDQNIVSENAEPSNAPLKSHLDTFTRIGVSTSLAEHLLTKLDIKAPTAIQRAAIPQLLSENSDAFIQAETGSGKTLAYLLPIVQKIVKLGKDLTQRKSGLFAIILAPTRELSKQISVVLESLLRCAHWIVSGTVIGGEKKKSEKARLRKGLNILIATPGRLVDHLDNTEVLDVSNVRWLVLDEGDRLMELGFEKDLARILSKLDFRAEDSHILGLPSKRTTILCSATMKSDVQRLGEISLKDALSIRGGAPEKSTTGATGNHEEKRFSAPAQLQQSFAVVPSKQRLVALAAVLKRAFARRGSVMRTIVFISCADSVDFHFEVFSSNPSTKDDDERGNPKSESKLNSDYTSRPAYAFSSKDNPVQIFKLHGSLPQALRTSTLAAFKNSKDPAVLVCTDVASRGLDLLNIDFVIEYDPPFNRDDHLHRIGRTARAGKDGRALIFLLPGSEESYIDFLKEDRQDGSRGVTSTNSTDILRKGFSSTGLVSNNDWEEQATKWQLGVERWALNDPNHLEQARRAYQSHLRAYATHVAAERHIFDMTQLHLGHLAKAFALRDKPASIRVPGLRPSKGSANTVKAERRLEAGGSSDIPRKDSAPSETQEAARKMRMKMKQQLTGVSEFNIG